MSEKQQTTSNLSKDFEDKVILMLKVQFPNIQRSVRVGGITLDGVFTTEVFGQRQTWSVEAL